MKKLLVFAGALLFLSFVFPNGVPLKPIVPAPVVPVVPPEPVTPPAPPAETSAEIVRILATAPVADRDRISGVYDALKVIMTVRDNGKRINTTEKWAELQANTLQLAIDTPGKYPGLDAAIEQVFKDKVGTDDVLSMTTDTLQKIAKACEVVSASAQTIPPPPAEKR